MNWPTQLIAYVGALSLVVGALWLLASRKDRYRPSKEDDETAEGLRKVSKRTGTRWGSAASVDEDLNSHHNASGSSDGDSGGGGSDS